jgi:hypothetical protein
MATTASITSEQTIEVNVNGPDDVTTMYIVTGIANSNLGTFSPSGGGFETQHRTFEAHVGPSLTTAQFRRAVATVSLASLSGQGGDASFTQWSVTDMDADFDDDEGKVQLQFDLSVTVDAGATNANAVVGGVGFQVIILAASTA